MTKVGAAKARKEFAEYIERSAHKKERIVITKNNKSVVALVPIEDLERLQELEDQVDSLAVKKARAEAKRGGTVSWEKMKKDMKL